jgi:hypothetical protein
MVKAKSYYILNNVDIYLSIYIYILLLFQLLRVAACEDCI